LTGPELFGYPGLLPPGTQGVAQGPLDLNERGSLGREGEDARKSKGLPQLLHGQVRVAQNALENLGVKDLSGVVGDGDALTFRVSENPMASAGAHFLKTKSAQCVENLRRSDAGKPWAHTAISRIAKLTSPAAGSGSPRANRSSKCNRMASRMFRMTSSYVRPCV
jgi:hypothetical protein